MAPADPGVRPKASANGRSGGKPAASRPAAAKVERKAAGEPRQAREGSRPEPKSRRRRRGGGAYAAGPQLTSVSTSRTAYTETRIWLLEQHGPICAYCGVRFTSDVMTLDHVAPRRGLTAYDRRDNLVLACRGCNAAKADKAPIAFLLGSRNRAANMLRYGQHLSPMLVELARSLAKDEPVTQRDELRKEFARWAELDDRDESPYKS